MSNAPEIIRNLTDERTIADLQAELCRDSKMKCPICGRGLLGRVIHEVATMYGCPRGCHFCVVDEDGCHPLHFSHEAYKLRNELSAQKAAVAERKAEVNVLCKDVSKLSGEVAALKGKHEALSKELQWHARYWRGLERMPHAAEAMALNPPRLRQIAKQNADRAEAALLFQRA